MVTFKAVVLKHHKKDDGTFNIKIRVTSQRQKRYIKTPYFVTSKDITRSYEIKNQHYIDLCDAIIHDFRKKLEPYGMAVLDMSVDKAVELITAKDYNCVLFTDILEDYRKVRNITEGTRKNFISCQQSLVKFLGKDSINLCELNSQILQKWVFTLPTKSAYIYASKLKALFRFAMKALNDEENGIKVIQFNPLDKVEIPKVSHTDKKAISVDELRRFIDYKGKRQRMLARDITMLSFYLVGINMVDLFSFKKSDFEGEYLEYNRTKTKNRRDDNAYMKIRIVPEAREIALRVYDDMKSKNVLSLTSFVNFNLKHLAKEIGVERIVFYTARHTWATLAVNDCKIDKYTVHLALNHVDNKTAITDVYIKKDFSAVDEANRKVIDYVLNKKGGQ